eukprot:m.52122 g.52122  ORF g.52122 m.52122 type:complete len:230 (-) comp10773_c0_seq3:2085-2774(-)
MMAALYVLPMILASTSVADCEGLPIPFSPDGNAIKKNMTGVVELELFWDWLCPYSRNHSYGVLDASRHYGDKLQLIIHPFPLPYHRHAFETSWASFVARALAGDSMDKQLQFGIYAFSQQTALYNDPTFNMTPADIQNILARWGNECCGFDTAQFLGLFTRKSHSGELVYLNANEAWKYSANRGIAATPTTFVNGVPVLNSNSTWKLADWINLLDPIFARNNASWDLGF